MALRKFFSLSFIAASVCCLVFSCSKSSEGTEPGQERIILRADTDDAESKACIGEGATEGTQHNYYYPFISFTKSRPDRRLDHIVYKNSASQGVTPTSYKTIRRTYVAEDDATWCPSDHFAVVAYMTFD